jgi:hypothetical protein
MRNWIIYNGFGTNAAVMIYNRKNAVAATAVLSSPGTGHTCVSCHHPIPLSQHNNPSSNDDCQQKTSFSNIDPGATSLSRFVPSTGPTVLKLILIVELLKPNAHDQSEYLILARCIANTRKAPGYRLRLPPLSVWLRFEIDALVPKQHNTDNPIVGMIFFEICSLCLTLWQQLGRKIAVSGLIRSFALGIGITSLHGPTRRVGIYKSI